MKAFVFVKMLLTDYSRDANEALINELMLVRRIIELNLFVTTRVTVCESILFIIHDETFSVCAFIMNRKTTLQNTSK